VLLIGVPDTKAIAAKSRLTAVERILASVERTITKVNYGLREFEKG
jgi:hypothetical protein